MKKVLAAALMGSFALATPALAADKACKEEWPASGNRHVPVAKEVLGSWELQSLTQVDEKGDPLPAGTPGFVQDQQPNAGEITLFPDGRIFVLMTRKDRAKELAAKGAATDSLAGFFSMRGTYVFECGLLTYTPAQSSDVRREKVPFLRWAQLEGDNLYLRTAKEQTNTYWLLHWKRIR